MVDCKINYRGSIIPGQFNKIPVENDNVNFYPIKKSPKLINNINHYLYMISFSVSGENLIEPTEVYIKCE